MSRAGGVRRGGGARRALIARREAARADAARGSARAVDTLSIVFLCPSRDCVVSL